MMETRVQHEPAEACDGTHCHWHHVDEPAIEPFYIWCGECGHVYRSARELRREYRRQFWGISRRFGDPLWLRLWRVLSIRASKIYFCQFCIHDFWSEEMM